jgi:RNA polymerase sigma-70 factor (ECF subfamily)
MKAYALPAGRAMLWPAATGWSLVVRTAPDTRQPDAGLWRVLADIAGIGSREAVEATEDFDSFYAAVFARLVGQLTLVTGDPHEAEDVVQEAMARAASRWTRLRAYDAPEAWVRRVAFNLAVSAHRRARRRLAALLRLGPPLPVPPVSLDALAQALQALTVAHRQVVVLYYLADLPVEQVAHELGVPVGTVKARLARARGALAARLADPAQKGKQA